jgi:hypothetical protein
MLIEQRGTLVAMQTIVIIQTESAGLQVMMSDTILYEKHYLSHERKYHVIYTRYQYQTLRNKLV